MLICQSSNAVNNAAVPSAVDLPLQGWHRHSCCKCKCMVLRLQCHSTRCATQFRFKVGSGGWMLSSSALYMPARARHIIPAGPARESCSVHIDASCIKDLAGRTPLQPAQHYNSMAMAATQGLLRIQAF